MNVESGPGPDRGGRPVRKGSGVGPAEVTLQRLLTGRCWCPTTAPLNPHIHTCRKLERVTRRCRWLPPPLDRLLKRLYVFMLCEIGCTPRSKLNPPTPLPSSLPYLPHADRTGRFHVTRDHTAIPLLMPRCLLSLWSTVPLLPLSPLPSLPSTAPPPSQFSYVSRHLMDGLQNSLRSILPRHQPIGA